MDTNTQRIARLQKEAEELRAMRVRVDAIREASALPTFDFDAMRAEMAATLQQLNRKRK